MSQESRMKHAVTSTASALKKEAAGQSGEIPTQGVVSLTVVEEIISTWSNIPQKVARQTIEKYGPPNEATPSRLIWYNTEPWKRTIVYRDEVPHNFPKPHTDVLEQFLDYGVPADAASDIFRYDGSVIVERTKGEVSARCDMEEMNFLAINLMHEIATGQRSVEQARKLYAETAVGFMMHRPSPYTEGLQFRPPEGDTADLDETMIAEPMLDQTMEKIKDIVGGE